MTDTEKMILDVLSLNFSVWLTARDIREKSNNEIKIRYLYVSLSRLRKQGDINSEPVGDKRGYKITGSGRKKLDEANKPKPTIADLFNPEPELA